MGTPYQKPIDPHFLHDLKVTLQDSRLLYPFQETKKRSMFLSNIDQVLRTFNVQTADFFPCNPSFPPELVKQRLETALSKLLVSYDFLGGRLKMNPESKRLEIDCNAAGAGFVVGSSEYTLDEIGDLVYPNPAFRQLAVQSLDFLAADDQPLFILQVTSFKCGGFAIGFSVNHVTFDGIGFKMFLDNLASQAFDHEQPLAITPCNDRHLLAARSPPRVTFPHHELLELKNIPTGDEPLPTALDPPPEDMAINLFKLTSNDVARLKETAKAGPTNGTAKITGFNVVTAHVWRCRALSVDAQSDRESTLLYAVNIRPRLRPPLPESYSGNAVLTTYVTARCTELENGPFSSLVEMVTQGAARMTDEYARSAIDWGSLHKGFPHGDFLLSSWWRLGFMEVEYPWGQPRYSCPIVHHRKDIILLFPDIDKASSNSVNVLVALPPKEMEKFETLFYKFLI